MLTFSLVVGIAQYVKQLTHLRMFYALAVKSITFTIL